VTLHTWFLFIATVFVVSAIPGPNMLLVMTHGARHGLQGATATMAGCLSALILMLAISAIGLGALLVAWPATFTALKTAGALYVVYLGIKSWRAKTGGNANPGASSSPAGRAAQNAAARFRNGFLVASSNPKAILFAGALLPQFVRADAPKLPQFAALIATFAIVEVSWYVVYAGAGTRIGERLRDPRVARVFNRLTGGIFAGFGAVMALSRR
jgi:threonine/homoserine/homoserine lactone efflux protein